MPQSSTLGTVLSCDSLDDVSQRFAFAGVDSGLTSDGHKDDCDDEDTPLTEGASTSALASTSVSSPNAVPAVTSLAARRFHRRQLASVRHSLPSGWWV
jgi:hypothetical protein